MNYLFSDPLIILLISKKFTQVEQVAIEEGDTTLLHFEQLRSSWR